MEDVVVTEYDLVSTCYVPSNGPEFGNAVDTFADLVAWLRQLATIGETCTYDAVQDLSFLRTFLLDVRDIAGGYLFVTWNEESGTEGAIRTIAAGSAIGHAVAEELPVDQFQVPGYPSYFVVLPAQNKMANIRFEQLRNGNTQFKHYVTSFMSKLSNVVAFDADGIIEGYRDAATGTLYPNCEVSFRTRVLRRDADLVNIRARHADVRRVIRRTYISPIVAEEKTVLNMLREKIGMAPNNRLKADIPIEYKLDLRTTPEQLDAMMAAGMESDGDWSDMGFIFARETQQVVWLSGAMRREKLKLDVDRSADGMIDVSSLAEAITGRRLAFSWHA